MFQRAFLATVFFAFVTASSSLNASDVNNYVVVSLVEKGDSFERSGAKLIKLRKAKGTRASINDWDSLLAKLKELQPEYVVFVARPEQIDVNFSRQLFNLATRVDDDPFVDFAKIEARVPLSSHGIASVVVDKLPFGEDHPAKKITAAIETHGRKTWLHIKAAFERPELGELIRYTQGVSTGFVVKLDSSKGNDQVFQVATAQ